MEGISSDQQRIIFEGKRLDDDRTFAEYNIPEDSTIQLAMCLRK